MSIEKKDQDQNLPPAEVEQFELDASKTTTNRFWNWLVRPQDNSSLIAFRMLFALLMVIELCRYLTIASYQYHGGLHFTYPFFDFVTPLSSNPETNELLVQLGYFVMLISMVLVAIGLLTKLALLLFLVLYSYFFLMEETFYNNHFYLIILLAFLALFTRLGGAFSVDAFLRKKQERWIPFWQLGILRLQWCIAYFYAGLAKLQPDWLGGEPVRGIFLEQNPNVQWIIAIVGLEPLTWIVAFGGVLFDLTVPFLLLFRRTRVWILLPFFVFHLSNHFLFEIGIFPWMAMCSIVLFLEPDWPRKIWERVGFGEPSIKQDETKLSSSFALQPIVAGFLTIYFAWQLVMPLRHYVYPGRSDWNQQGYKFAWRMMLNHWDAYLRINVVETNTGRSVEWNNHEAITQVQFNRMQYQPRLLAQYAKFVKSEAEKLGFQSPEIRIIAVVSLNGRSHQFLVNPHMDASADWSQLVKQDWILPLEKNVRIGDYPKTLEERLKLVSSAKMPKPPADNNF